MRTLPALVIIVVFPACARLTPEQQIVEDAVSALGGRDRVLAVKTLVLDGEGTQFNLGQDMTPGAATQTFTVSAYRRAIDVANGRARAGLKRTPGFAYFRGPAPQQQTADLSPAEGAHHPIAIVRLALDPATKLDNPRTIGSESVVAMTTASGLAFTLAIDTTTKLPTRAVSMTDHAVLGDVAIETSFAGYEDVNGLRLPTRLITKTDDFTTADLRIRTQSVDADLGALAEVAPAPAPAPPAVVVQEVTPGVWLLGGQSHHSVAVERTDHLLLFEAPSEARTLAVIAKARELRPGKPVTHVVNSHHHFDHSGGIRAAVSEGLTVMTHGANAAFFRDLVGRSRTIAPDALTRNPQPLEIETVDDELILKDETRPVHLYHIVGSPHGDALLMAYLPRERLLIQADAFGAGNTFNPYAANLLENIRKRNLRVDRMVSVHGPVAPFAELVKAAQATTTN
ncbi:MAG: MBL fold metallo-hydrolase [Vicinamibacterales bacterium]